MKPDPRPTRLRGVESSVAALRSRRALLAPRAPRALDLPRRLAHLSALSARLVAARWRDVAQRPFLPLALGRARA